MTQQQTSPYTGRPIVDWYDEKITLRDVNGDKIGDVVEINPDYLIVESDGGFLGLGERHIYYVPRSYVARDEGAERYLSVTKDQAEALDWREPPADSQWAGSDRQQELRTDYPDYDQRPDATRLVRWEEDLQASKADQQVGEVVVNKRIVEETKTIEVPVRREEVHIERRPVSGDASTDTAFTDQQTTVRVPVMEEQVEVRKVVRPVEEIEITKTPVQETRQVQDTVRREEFEVDDTTPATSKEPRA